jgi:hypothetical protein
MILTQSRQDVDEMPENTDVNNKRPVISFQAKFQSNLRHLGCVTDDVMQGQQVADI